MSVSNNFPLGNIQLLGVRRPGGALARSSNVHSLVKEICP